MFTINAKVLNEIVSRVAKRGQTVQIRRIGKFIAFTSHAYPQVQATLDVGTGENRTVYVDSDALKVILRCISKGEEITVRFDDGGMIFAFEAGVIRMPAHETEPTEFPEWSGEPDVGYHIEAEEWRRIVKRTGFAALTDRTRQVLCGIRFDANTQKVVATNTHVMAVTSVKTGLEFSESFTVDEKVVRLLWDENLDIEAQGNRVRIAQNHNGVYYDFRSNTTGIYPNWERIVPEPNGYRVVMHREALIRTLKRVAPIAKGNAHRCRIKFGYGMLKDVLAMTVSARAEQYGEVSESIITEEAPAIDAGYEIAANARYLIQMLQAVEDEKVTFWFANPSRPLLMEGEDTKLIVMPMALA